MEIRLAYGEVGITLDVPGSIEVDRFGGSAVDQPVTQERFEACYREAGGSARFDDTVPLIVVNDGYRSTPTSQVLSWLDDIHPGMLDRSHFLIATGSHAAPTENHLKAVFGSLLPRVRERVTWHDCRDLDAMRPVGTDSRGKTVYLNTQCLDARAVLVIGSVEPHYFAGYTGGRKAFFPGLTDLATIERNHNLANFLDAQPLRLAGNPVAEDLERLLDLIDTSRVFSIQVVMDVAHTIGSVHCGDIRKSLDSAAEAARRLYAHQVDRPYDLLLAELRPPLDRNIYQAQKALENNQAVVRDGGDVVVIGACNEGAGSPHFFELARQWDREKNEASDGIQRFGSHKLSRVNAMTRRIGVWLCSGVDPMTARQVFYEPVENLQRFVEQRLADGGRLAVVHDAGHTVLTM